MGDLIPVIEGPVKFRDGKKWKARYACVTRLSPVADSLTLQLWKDKKDCERNPPSKGSLSLQEYLGWEAGFTLDKESQTLALILKEDVIIFALDNRENLMRWQVRVTGQFEEGQHFNAHLIQVPPKSKLPQGAIKIHVQNRRFSMTHGVPPRLVHSWNLADLRRYGGLENGRFCFEGGSRCGKGEGIHVLRLDGPDDLQHAFDAATKGKLESKRKSVYKSMPKSPSLSSHLDGCGVSAAQSVLSVATACSSRHFDDRHHNSGAMSDLSSTDSMATLLHSSNGPSLRGSRDDLLRTRSTSRSRSGNASINWSIKDGSSCETMSIALSELTEASCLPQNNCFQNQMSLSGIGVPPQQHSPEHLVNRKDLLERMGIPTGPSGKHSRSQAGSRSMGTSGDFVPQWSMDFGNNCSSVSTRGSFKGQSSRSIDRISISSHDSQASSGGAPSEASSSARSNYDTPKSAIGGGPNSHFGQQRLSWSVQSQGGISQHSMGPKSPPSTPRSQRSSIQSRPSQEEDPLLREMYASIPCKCELQTKTESNKNPYDNYDIPRSLCKQEAMQYYDTPRSMKEALEGSEGNASAPVNPYGNYDVPHPGSQPIPVFKKSCGCIMKLNNKQKESGEFLTWTCIGNDSSDIKLPRVKLTGTGKMPVADMRSINNVFQCQQQISQDENGQSGMSPNQQPTLCLDPNVKGLPPKSPVYAVVNKINKKKSQPQSPQHQQAPPQHQQVQPQHHQAQPQHQQSQNQQALSQQAPLQHPLNNHLQPVYAQLTPQPFALPQSVQPSPQSFNIQQPNHNQGNLNNGSPYHGQLQISANGGAQYHNYCNIAPLLGDIVKQSGSEYHQMSMINVQKQTDSENQNGHYYENSAAVLSRLKEEEQNSHQSSDYLPMDPKMFQNSKSEMPLVPFEPFDYICKDGDVVVPPQYESIDPISQKLIEFQDALDTDDTSYANLVNSKFYPLGKTARSFIESTNDNCLFNLCDLSQSLQLDGEVDFNLCDLDHKASSIEILATTGWLNDDPTFDSQQEIQQQVTKSSGYDTIPRSNNKNQSESSHHHGHHSNSGQNQAVTMRRSSSVPCKPITDRGSTSSSDSGFSPGSPNHNTSSSLSNLLGS